MLVRILDAVLKPFHLQVVQETQPGEVHVPDCFGRNHSSTDPLCTGSVLRKRCDYYNACARRLRQSTPIV